MEVPEIEKQGPSAQAEAENEKVARRQFDGLFERARESERTSLSTDVDLMVRKFDKGKGEERISGERGEQQEESSGSRKRWRRRDGNEQTVSEQVDDGAGNKTGEVEDGLVEEEEEEENQNPPRGQR